MTVTDQPTRIAFPKSELPQGAKRIVTVGRREIAVFNVGGELHALFNRCPHQQAPLAKGKVGGTRLTSEVGVFEYGLKGRVLRCPWHRYEFDLSTGRCIADPERLRVRVYEVREEGDEIALYV